MSEDLGSRGETAGPLREDSAAQEDQQNLHLSIEEVGPESRDAQIRHNLYLVAAGDFSGGAVSDPPTSAPRGQLPRLRAGHTLAVHLPTHTAEQSPTVN